MTNILKPLKSMKLTFKTKLAIFLFSFSLGYLPIFSTATAHANSYGTNITVNDGVYNSATPGVGLGREDNEVEPGMVHTQAWDLEGFFQNGSKITIVGGYNFYTGEEGMMPGDIFIDTNGDSIHSPNTIPGFTYQPYEQVANSYFNYDYVLDVNWEDQTFDIVQLDAKSLLEDTKYGSSYNVPSNPWIYLSGGTEVERGLNFESYNKSSVSDTGFNGWGGNNNHYAATFDLASISAYITTGTLFHNTMECGNDNLLGIDPVPEPATMFLFGAGLLGIASFIKKKKN